MSDTATLNTNESEVRDFEESPAVENVLPTDSFAVGMTSLIGLSAIQKVVGFLRTIAFCWLLTDDQLGRWSLGLNFITMMAPFAMLGLPGTFGKYTEYFRQRGQLRSFLRRTVMICAFTGVVAVALVMITSTSIANSLFSNANQQNLVYSLALGLGTAIVWNFLNELLTSLRMIRVASFLQFVNGISFTVVGALLVLLSGWDEMAIVFAFSFANVLSTVLALAVLVPQWKTVSGADLSVAREDVVKKLLPFAGWVWLANLMVNSLTSAPAFLIKNLSGVDAITGDSLVGQFQSSRVIPMIMVMLAGYIGAVVLPYLCHDWEAGRKNEVSKRLNLTLKSMALVFSLLGSLILICSPILFGTVLRHRYDAGLALVPWTLTYCTWFSLVFISQNYLWCIARAWLLSIAVLAGLVVNVVLGYLLIPTYGLYGATWATVAGNAVTLVMVYLLAKLQGFQIDRGVLLTSILPIALGCGGAYGAAVILVGSVIAFRSELLFREEEKESIRAACSAAFDKIITVLLAIFQKIKNKIFRRFA